jgi:HEAT repeat protein
MNALIAMGTHALPHAAEIAAGLEDRDAYVRMAASRVLRTLGLR